MPPSTFSPLLFIATSCGILFEEVAASDATLPSVPEAISALRYAATVYDEAAMKTAVAHLVRLGRSALPPVHQLMGHEDANVRWKAIQTLAAIGVAIALHAGLAYALLHLAHQAPLPTPLSSSPIRPTNSRRPHVPWEESGFSSRCRSASPCRSTGMRFLAASKTS